MEAVGADAQARGTSVSKLADLTRLVLEEVVPSDQMMLESLARTPERMARALENLTEGYKQTPADILGTTFDREEYDQIIVVKNIPFASLCEHHCLPFLGEASVAYLPSKRIVGLSKIPRLVKCFARRLQVQERLTQQIAKALNEALEPEGVAVIIEASHTCMLIRGAESQGKMVTSAMTGTFRDSPNARVEAMALMGR